MGKQRNTFRTFESRFERKAKMVERQYLRQKVERARLNTDTDYIDDDDDSYDDSDWYDRQTKD